MDFEGFKESMLESAARHDAEIAIIRESLKSVAESLTSVTNTVGRLVDNQIFLQESLDALATQTREDHAQTQKSLRELERIVFRHVSDPDAHNVN
jgi:hypothetical protein